MARADELYAALEANDPTWVERLLEADRNLLGSINETPPPLHWAVWQDRSDMVEVLLDHGADIERKDKDRDATPLAWAIVYGRQAIIPKLVARGAKLGNTGGSDNMLQLAMKGAAGGFEEYGEEVASRREFGEIVELLRELGALTGGAKDEFYMRPVLFVENVEARARYYCEKLGFSKSYGDRLFAQVERNGLEIMLGQRDLDPSGSSNTVLSQSLRDPDRLGDLYQLLKKRGARVSSEPYEVAWQHGTYELRVEDVDGNVLLFWGNKPDS